ncbi:site-specific integrase [Streptomyces sp. SS]|uniref:site-specific integrase n=1 Tax=Streptomyces sp. SS TaxID=260742 RepID=UPI00031E7444|nr:site-specific integrase [Streptomyces sp. SS]
MRGTVVIPSLGYVKQALTVADEDLALEIVMMAGCGLRNGEARAVNVNNVLARDAYRVREQIHSNTLRPAKLKHRKAGEFREVPLPRSVREAIERYETKHGTTQDGYLLRGPGGYFAEGMERRRVRKLFADLPPEEGGGDVRLPALLRLERPRERDSDHRRGGVDGPQVHRGDVRPTGT